MATLKLTIKDQWFDISTNKLKQTLVSTETIHIDDDLDFESMKNHYIKNRIGVSELDGVRHESTLVTNQLSKGEMFEFILNNNVTLTPDNTTWTKYHDDGTEEKFVKQYCVSINGHGMSGYDLEEAINYYVQEIQK